MEHLFNTLRDVLKLCNCWSLVTMLYQTFVTIQFTHSMPNTKIFYVHNNPWVLYVWRHRFQWGSSLNLAVSIWFLFGRKNTCNFVSFAAISSTALASMQLMLTPTQIHYIVAKWQIDCFNIYINGYITCLSHGRFFAIFGYCCSILMTITFCMTVIWWFNFKHCFDDLKLFYERV